MLEKEVTLKKVIMALALLLLSCVLVACSINEEQVQPKNTDVQGTVTFWHSFTQGARLDALDQTVERFQQAYPNVTVTTEVLTWADFKDRWRRGIETGDLPDISTACNIYEVEELVNAGILQPVNTVVDRIGRQRFADNVLTELSHDCDIYGLPYYSHAFVLWYRNDLLEEAHLDLPQTWEEFAAAAKALTDPDKGIYGYAAALNPRDHLATIDLHMYMRSKGDSLLTDDLKANLTSDTALEGIRYWADIYRSCSAPEYYDDTVEERSKHFYDGETAFDVNSGFHIAGIKNNRPDLLDSISCVEFPFKDEDFSGNTSVVTQIPLVMYASAENKEATEAFLEFLYQDENYLAFIDSVPVGMIPAIKDIANTEAFQSNETRKQFAQEETVIENAVLSGNAPGFEHGANLQAGILTSSGVIEEMFRAIVIDDATVEVAAKQAEDELNARFVQALGK